MAIRAVVFDIGGVLEIVDDASWPEIWLSRWQGRSGMTAASVAVDLARHAPEHDVATGRISEAQFRAAYAGALRLDDRQADQMMAEMWDAYCGRLDVELRDFAAALRPDLATAILSNSADGARREEQRRYGFQQLVDVLVYSHEVGLAKPDPAIFRLTQSLLGVAPAEIVFLDDHQGHVDAARACGWHAVLHRDTSTSIDEIMDLIEPDGHGDQRSETQIEGT